MIKIKELLRVTKEKDASDLHLAVGIPPTLRVRGRLIKVGDAALDKDDLLAAVKEILPKEKASLLADGSGDARDIDLAVEIEGLARFRTNIYRDRNGYAVAFRLIPSVIKPLKDLGLPKAAEEICSMTRGLVLVTGITGSGKSTTLASIVDNINSERDEHIITVEDPIEFVHNHKKSIVNQRELGLQTPSFPDALRSSLREDPDVILVGEMRDLDTISMAITAAETGHLVLSTLHTRGAAQTIERITDVFPPHQQDQVRQELADALAMVISQVLIPSVDGKTMQLACEVMVGTSGIKNLIREAQTHQINSALQTGGREGMQTLDASLRDLVNAGKISLEDALPWVFDKASFRVKQGP